MGSSPTPYGCLTFFSEPMDNKYIDLFNADTQYEQFLVRLEDTLGPERRAFETREDAVMRTLWELIERKDVV